MEKIDLGNLPRDKLCQALLEESDIDELMDILEISKDDILTNIWYRVEEKIEYGSEALENIVLDYMRVQGYDMEESE